MQCLKNLSIEYTQKHYINEVYNRDNDMYRQMDMFYHSIFPLAYRVYYGTISIAIFAGNEASMNNLGEQMDINIKEAADYEVPDPPSVMRMKENEAYGTFSN